MKKFESYFNKNLNESFKFKTQKATGKYKSFEEDIIEIKVDNNIVGNITSLRNKKNFSNYEENENYEIILFINVDGSSKNKILKPKFSSVDDAENFLNKNYEQINKLNLYIEGNE